MKFHSFIEYARYSWKAKGRHGTHSPFVYDFVEHVLQDKEIISREHIVVCPDIPLKYENLISRISAHYNYKNVVHAGQPALADTDMVVISGTKAAEWLSTLNNYFPSLKNESVVVITGIHGNAANTGAWKACVADERVTMAIDVYGLGILLFRKEFKKRQVFVLKY